MKDRLNSYQDVYVAACGAVFTSRALAMDHEKGCPECLRTTAEDAGICPPPEKFPNQVDKP